jgi:hypothetical protein
MCVRKLTVIVLFLIVVLCGCSDSDIGETHLQAVAQAVPAVTVPPTMAPHADPATEDGQAEDGAVDVPNVQAELNENIFTAPKMPVRPTIAQGPAASAARHRKVILPKIQLVGFMSVDGAKALLKVDGKRTVSRAGDSIENVEIVDVAPPTVTLKLHGEEYTLDLTGNYRFDPDKERTKPKSRQTPSSSPRPQPRAASDVLTSTPESAVEVPQLPPLPGVGNSIGLPPLPGPAGGLRVPDATQ